MIANKVKGKNSNQENVIFKLAREIDPCNQNIEFFHNGNRIDYETLRSGLINNGVINVKIYNSVTKEYRNLTYRL
jgi:hypothetical protein